MALVLCEVSDGLRDSEATVKLLTFENRIEFIPVDRGLVDTEGNRHYLSVGLIHINREEGAGAALVSLPVEADSGAH